MMAKVFMSFKQVWLELLTKKRKVEPMLWRKEETRKRDAMNHWKWLIFYKHTKRAYLKYKREKQDFELKKEIFNCFKFRRHTFYNLVSKMRAISSNQLFKVYLHTFDKIRNIGAHERDELNYERKRALFTLLKAKVASI